MKIPNIQLVLTAAIAMALTGCGGPKYKSDFTSWLKMKFAEEMPVSVSKVSIQETASTDGNAVFQFEVSASVTDDLYAASPLYPMEKMQSFSSRLRALDDDAAQASGLLDLLHDFNGNREVTNILEIATPRGKKIQIEGKARATFGNDGWGFSIIEMNQVNLPGSPRAVFHGTAYIKGSPEEKTASKKASDFYENLEKLTTKAEKIQEDNIRIAADKFAAEMAKEEEEARLKAEAQRLADEKAAAEKAKRTETILARVADGKTFIATWQGQESRGQLGLRFGKGTQLPNGYSMEAVLFVPSQPEYSKAISAVLLGDGSVTSPFTIELRVPRHQSIIRRYQHRDGSGIGFIAGDASFTLGLVVNEDDGSMAGTLQRGDYGPRGPVQFLFTASDDSAAP